MAPPGVLGKYILVVWDSVINSFTPVNFALFSLTLKNRRIANIRLRFQMSQMILLKLAKCINVTCVRMLLVVSWSF